MVEGQGSPLRFATIHSRRYLQASRRSAEQAGGQVEYALRGVWDENADVAGAGSADAGTPAARGWPGGPMRSEPKNRTARRASRRAGFGPVLVDACAQAAGSRHGEIVRCAEAAVQVDAWHTLQAQDDGLGAEEMGIAANSRSPGTPTPCEIGVFRVRRAPGGAVRVAAPADQATALLDGAIKASNSACGRSLQGRTPMPSGTRQVEAGAAWGRRRKIGGPTARQRRCRWNRPHVSSGGGRPNVGVDVRLIAVAEQPDVPHGGHWSR